MTDRSGEMPRSLKLATVWLLLGAVVFVAVQAWQSQQQRAHFSVDGVSGAIELKRAADGHFHWSGTLNGIAVDFLVDTGATGTAIPQALADRAGLVAEGTLQSSTAGGVVQGSLARADVDKEVDGNAVERARPVEVAVGRALELDGPTHAVDREMRARSEERRVGKECW